MVAASHHKTLPIKKSRYGATVPPKSEPVPARTLFTVKAPPFFVKVRPFRVRASVLNDDELFASATDPVATFDDVVALTAPLSVAAYEPVSKFNFETWLVAPPVIV